MMAMPRTIILLLLLCLTGCVAPQTLTDRPNGELLSIKHVKIRAEVELLNHPALSHTNLDSKVRFYQIRYRSDGMSIGACLVEPLRPGVYPALIYNHGGNRNFGALTMDLEMLQLADLAAHGYVVVASQYRGVAGNPGRDEFGGADVHDVLNLIPLLESRGTVDRERIGMIGHSRGGMMTYLALARTARIKAAAVLAGPADLLALGRDRPEMYRVYRELIDEDPERLRSGLLARSALYWANELPPTTPLLLLHGTVDRRVSPSQSLEMADRLADTGVPFQLVLLEGLGHSWHAPEVTAQLYQWFDRILKGPSP